MSRETLIREVAYRLYEALRAEGLSINTVCGDPEDDDTTTIDGEFNLRAVAERVLLSVFPERPDSADR